MMLAHTPRKNSLIASSKMHEGITEPKNTVAYVIRKSRGDAHCLF